ncbi:MAG: hypothetical protein ACPGTQ_04410 [Colwellia sp.]
MKSMLRKKLILQLFTLSCLFSGVALSQSLLNSTPTIAQASSSINKNVKLNKTNEVNDLLIHSIKQAIEDISESSRKHWQVTIAHYENEEGDISSRIEQYSPSKKSEELWTLLRQNGNAPTDKQRKAFTEMKNQETRVKKDKKSFTLSLKKLVKTDTLSKVSENDKEIVLAFNVEIEKLGDDARGKLFGTLYYNKEHGFIERISIVNKEEFSPLFSASIESFSLNFYFTKIGNAILPSKQEMAMTGTFAYFSEIDEVSTVTYSGYKKVL